jgi:hypothetical protein
MVADLGHLLDHARDPGKGPVVGVEPVRASALPERLPDGGKLGIRQARDVPGRAGAAQRLQSARAPLGVPAAGVLPGDTQFAGDLGLGAAGGEQLAGLETDVFEGLAVAQTTGVAAVGGWSHPAMLPGQPLIVSSEGAKLFRPVGRGLIGARLRDRDAELPSPPSDHKPNRPPGSSRRRELHGQRPAISLNRRRPLVTADSPSDRCGMDPAPIQPQATSSVRASWG